MVQVQALLLGISLVVAVGVALYTHFASSHESPRNAYTLRVGPSLQSPSGRRRKRKLSSCSICLCDVHPTLDLRELQCGHTFHRKCIELWFRSADVGSCPNCRSPVHD